MKKIEEQLFNVYGKGIVNTIEDTLIDEGASSESINFLTLPDRIELIKGRRLIGAEESTNKGVLGMGKIEKVDGTELILRKIGTVLQYYNTTTELWVNAKTGLLPDEPLYFSNSFTPAGRQVWMCGQDGLFKLYPSSPASVIDLTDSTKNYKGQISIDKSRMFCWGMKEDPTGLRFSKIDKDSNYTLIAAEAISSATASHYTGTLTKGQVFGLVFTKGAQVLRDDKNGNLTGDGTGTINYATGAYVLDFTTSNATAVTCSYLWEDPLTNGLADFRYSATRLAGEGNVLRQDSIGTKSQIVLNFNDSYYTLQDKGSWIVKIATTDLTFDNQIYRLNIGCPSANGAVVTADGIVFVDTYNPELPKLRVLEFNQIGDRIIPTDLSINFKMEDYTFDSDTFLYKKGDWILIFCKKDSPNNNTIIVYNIRQRSFDIALYPGNNAVELLNKIIAGDSQTPNTYELFTGVDDLDYEITAHWIGNKKKLKTEYLKKFKKLRLTGYIDLEQSFDIYISYDNEEFVRIGTIYGDGQYVDPVKTSLIGTAILGDEIIGLADSSKAGYFETEIKVRTPKFKRFKLKYVPLGVGYLSILEQKISDIRIKSSKIPKKYKAGTGTGVGFSSIDDAFIVN
jgi:hypothetical protein